MVNIVGNKFKDASGNVVQLRGTNQIGLHYACLTNQGGIDAVFGGVPHDAASIVAMRDLWAMNSIRLVINVGCWLNCCVSPFTYGAAYINPILTYINQLLAAGIYVIVTIAGTASGTGEMADSSATTFWQDFAPRYANNPMVLYEPYNEPHGITWNTWLNGGNNSGSLSYSSVGMQSLVNTIRGAGANNPLLLDGISFAGDLTQLVANLPTDNQHQLGAVWHAYSGNPDTPLFDIGTWHDEMQGVNNSIPLVANEFGAYANNQWTIYQQIAWIDTLLDFCDSQGISYMNWAWAQANILNDYVLYQPAKYGINFYKRLNRLKKNGAKDGNNTRLPVFPPSQY